MKHRIRRLHFIGMGGSGMSGLAEVMLNSGYQISGSDIADSPALDRLRSLGASVSIGHESDAVNAADVAVYSSAIGANNPELVRARAKGLPVVPRSAMLGELLRSRTGIAVAGTHGKTTITSMIATVLHGAGLDPTYVVGGVVRQFAASAGLGKGEYMVVESDESDGSFLHLQPVIAVASNIDFDHMEQYGHDLRRLKRAFADFFENLPFYGLAIICQNDPALRDVSGVITKRVIRYGIERDDCDFAASDIRIEQERTLFTLRSASGERQCVVNAVGRHNVLNCLAALAVADELNVPESKADLALRKFAGVKRRLERLGRIRIGAALVDLVDDYGHHPTEITASLSALAQSRPGKRLVLVFQPHRHSRTRDHFDALADALADADMLVLTDIYSAGEKADGGPSGQDLAHAVRLRGRRDTLFVGDLDDIPARLAAVVRNGDQLVVMGAGSIATLARQLAEAKQ